MSSDREESGCGRCVGALFVIVFLVLVGTYCAFPAAQSVFQWTVKQFGPGLGTAIGIVAAVIVFIVVMLLVIRFYS